MICFNVNQIDLLKYSINGKYEVHIDSTKSKRNLSVIMNLNNDYEGGDLIFGDQKMGDLIQVGMDPKEAKEWFGNTPPDLTLEAGLRGPDWIYTYLKSFYIDDSRPLGVNNKVYENVGMPHVLLDMQGTPRSVCKQIPVIADNGGIKQDPLTGQHLTQEKCGFLEVDDGTGELSPKEFDQAMLDLTNFLAYMTDPMKVERESIGTYVLLYLFIFTMLSYLLYREFKKDLH